MAAKDALSRFVRDALSAGRSRDEIRAELGAAGWSPREISEALAAYAETAFVPPVPRPVPRFTARDVFVYALLFTALALTAVQLVTLVHAVIDAALPDPAFPDPWRGRERTRIRWAISILAVSTPLYLWLSLRTGRRIEADRGERPSPVRRWLTYLALFVAALVFLGDISYVIYNFLSGELTLRFLLKAATVALVAGGLFAFYIGDVRERTDEP